MRENNLMSDNKSSIEKMRDEDLKLIYLIYRCDFVERRRWMIKM